MENDDDYGLTIVIRCWKVFPVVSGSKETINSEWQVLFGDGATYLFHSSHVTLTLNQVKSCKGILKLQVRIL